MSIDNAKIDSVSESYLACRREGMNHEEAERESYRLAACGDRQFDSRLAAGVARGMGAWKVGDRT